MKVLITGAAGFIGSHVAERLSQHATVLGIDDLSTGSRSNLDGIDCELIEESILNVSALEAAVADVDAVIHLAALPSVPRSIADPLSTHAVNATGTLLVLQAAAATGRKPQVVVASSSSVYGANPNLPKHESMTPMPMSPYAVSKLATEQYALAWTYSYGLPTLVFRLFNVFGPRQDPGHAYAAVIPKFVDATLREKPLTIHGDGHQSRDFTYVGTVAEVIADAVVRRIASPMPINLAYGSRTELLEVVDIISGITESTPTVEHIGPRTGDVRHSQSDGVRLRELFPDIVPVDLDSGIRSTVAWMREHVS